MDLEAWQISKAFSLTKWNSIWLGVSSGVQVIEKWAEAFSSCGVMGLF